MFVGWSVEQNTALGAKGVAQDRQHRSICGRRLEIHAGTFDGLAGGLWNDAVILSG